MRYAKALHLHTSFFCSSIFLVIHLIQFLSYFSSPLMLLSHATWNHFISHRDEKEIDFAEQLESVAYVLCGEGSIIFEKFISIWNARGVSAAQLNIPFMQMHLLIWVKWMDRFLKWMDFCAVFIYIKRQNEIFQVNDKTSKTSFVLKM